MESSFCGNLCAYFLPFFLFCIPSKSRELEDLESMCSSTVYLLNTTVNAVQHVCWKVLLHVLVTGKHNQAASIFAKSLAYLVEKCDSSILGKTEFENNF